MEWRELKPTSLDLWQAFYLRTSNVLRSMKILFLSTWFPYPLDTGARIRVHHLLKALANHHDVHLISFMKEAKGENLIPTLHDWGIEVEIIRGDPYWRDPSKALIGHLSLKPRDVVIRYSEEMARLVSQATSRHQFDVIIASFTDTAPYAIAMQGIPRILEEHNFLTSWMEERFRSKSSPPKRAANWVTWQKCRRYERWLYPQFDACTMVSEKDRNAVRANIPQYQGPLEVIPNGVDTGRNRPGLADPQPNTLVFNGALTYYANADAMRFFLEEVLPLIHTRRPGVRLDITGRTDGVDLSKLPLDGNVTLTGYLDDVRPTVAGSWACVVPLRVGGGTRLKILEAMALGTPVVSTTKGAEGLEVTPEHDILIADDPNSFAEQTIRLLNEPELRQHLSSNGRKLVEQKYDWQQIGQRFCDFVELASQLATRKVNQ